MNKRIVKRNGRRRAARHVLTSRVVKMAENDCPGVCCNNCIVGSYMLIDSLVKDIQLLASEVVRLRYMISFHIPKHTGEMLRFDILSDLYCSYYDYPIYQNYMSSFYGGEDPLDSDKFCKHMLKLSKGEKSTDEFPSLTF